MFESFFLYLNNSSPITLGVLGLLSFYFILILWIFTYKSLSFFQNIKLEEESLNLIITEGFSQHYHSKLCRCINDAKQSKELLNACEMSIIKEMSKGISWISIVASTAPFIGLFGTVVGILESFAHFGTTTKVAFGDLAPLISEALIATACGIFVAIFAYTFHQILQRKLYELHTIIKAEIEIILAKSL